MKHLLLSIMTVSLFAGCIHLLAPEGKLKKQIAFVTALVLCAALFAPLIQQMRRDIRLDLSLSSATPADQGEAREAILRLTAEAICRQLETEVSRLFTVENPTLTLTVDGSDPSAVVMQAGHLRGVGQVSEAAAYLAELLRCPVTAETIPQEESHESIS